MDVHVRERLHLKLERAERHISELTEAWADFLKEDPYPVRFEDDPKTGDRTYYVDSVREVPVNLSLIAGDAIHNLRSVLDHMAHHLVCIGMNSPGPFSHVYFPIAENRKKYDTIKADFVEGMRKDAKDAIDAEEPYGGGKGRLLWQLHQLDIIDKHRIVYTIGSRPSYQSMPPSTRKELAETFLGLPKDAPIPDGQALLTEMLNRNFPLKVGDKLCTVAKAEVEENIHFTFDIAFGEPHLVKGKRVLEVLAEFLNLVRDIVYRFDLMLHV
jgi:hypothetical protein